MKKLFLILFLGIIVASCGRNQTEIPTEIVTETPATEVTEQTTEEAEEIVETAEEVSVQETGINSIVGFYKLAGYSGQETGIEILSDGRCLHWWRADKIRKEYIGDVHFLGNGIFQIPFVGDVKRINLAYFSKGSVDESEGKASWWPDWRHSSVHDLLFERVSYGLCAYENISSYKSKDISDYYYAKFYKQ